jgi:hypothetical protein
MGVRDIGWGVLWTGFIWIWLANGWVGEGGVVNTVINFRVP